MPRTKREPAIPPEMIEKLRAAGYKVRTPAQAEAEKKQIEKSTIERMKNAAPSQGPTEDEMMALEGLEEPESRPRRRQPPPPPVEEYQEEAPLPANVTKMDTRKIHAIECASRGRDQYDNPLPCTCHVSPGQIPAEKAAHEPPRATPSTVAAKRTCPHGIPTIAPFDGCQHDPLPQDRSDRGIGSSGDLMDGFEKKARRGDLFPVKAVWFTDSQPFAVGRNLEKFVPTNNQSLLSKGYIDFDTGVLVLVWKFGAKEEEAAVVPLAHVRSAHLATE